MDVRLVLVCSARSFFYMIDGVTLLMFVDVLNLQLVLVTICCGLFIVVVICFSWLVMILGCST